MNGYATKNEFDSLKTRGDVLEREVEGEKTVSRYILEQTRRNGDDLAAVKTRLGRVETTLESLGGKVDGLDRTLMDLARNLPAIVAEAVRDVIGERGKRK